VTPEASLAVAAGAFCASLAATPLAARLATHVGLLDRPGPLKPHTRATPYLGGLGVAAGVGLGAAVVMPWLLVQAGMALALGTADDVRPLPPALRVLGELAIGLALAAVVSTRVGAAGYVLVPAATLALINGFNLLDGLDALCGAVALAAAIGFSALLTGDPRTLALALAATMAAFLIFNRPPAKVYLGDGGAYLVAVVVTALLACAWSPAQSRSTGIAALAVVALPVVEVVLALFRRVRSGSSLVAGDRDHPYDVLVRSGWSIRRTVSAYMLAELAAVALALAASHLVDPFAWVLTALTALGLLATGFRAASAAPNHKPMGERST